MAELLRPLIFSILNCLLLEHLLKYCCFTWESAFFAQPAKLKPCHTKQRFHCVGTDLFNFSERREIAR